MNFLCRTLYVIFFITLGQEQSLSKVCAHLSVCDHHPVSCCVILAESPNPTGPHFLLDKIFGLKNEV